MSDKVLELRNRVKQAYLDELQNIKIEFKFFYSNPNLFLQPCDVLLFGINPGGSNGNEINELNEEKQSWEDNRACWCAYLDESWKPGKHRYDKGEAPLQKRITTLFSALTNKNKEDGIRLLRKTPSSNLIPARTPNIHHNIFSRLETIDSNHNHEWFLEIVKSAKPKLIITFGRARKIEEILGLRPDLIKAWGNRMAGLSVQNAESKAVVLSLPHLARYCGDTRVAEFIQKNLEEGRSADIASNHRALYEAVEAIRQGFSCS